MVPDEAKFANGINGVDSPTLDSYSLGKSGAGCCKAILGYAGVVVDLARNEMVDGVIAYPQTQQSIDAGGIDFDGYPEFFARRTGTRGNDVFLMLSICLALCIRRPK